MNLDQALLIADNLCFRVPIPEKPNSSFFDPSESYFMIHINTVTTSFGALRVPERSGYLILSGARSGAKKEPQSRHDGDRKEDSHHLTKAPDWLYGTGTWAPTPV